MYKIYTVHQTEVIKGANFVLQGWYKARVEISVTA